MCTKLRWWKGVWPAQESEVWPVWREKGMRHMRDGQLVRWVFQAEQWFIFIARVCGGF